MEVLRKIGVAILVVILVNLICIFSLSCNIKKILVDGIIKETVVEQIVGNTYEEENYTITEEDINRLTEDERVRELLKSKEIQDLMNKYLDITMDSLAGEEEIDEVELEKDMLEYLKNNKEVISEILGQEVTDEMIDQTQEQLESKELSRTFKQSIENTKHSMSQTEKTVLKGYTTLISLKFKILLVFLMIMDTFFIALLQSSIYKWIKTLGQTMITSGFLIVLMSIVVKAFISFITQFKTFNTTSLLVTGLVIILIGIVLIAIYPLIEKKVQKKKLEEQQKQELEKRNDAFYGIS